jgi:hypothetical protein
VLARRCRWDDLTTSWALDSAIRWGVFVVGVFVVGVFVVGWLGWLWCFCGWGVCGWGGWGVFVVGVFVVGVVGVFLCGLGCLWLGWLGCFCGWGVCGWGVCDTGVFVVGVFVTLPQTPNTLQPSVAASRARDTYPQMYPYVSDMYREGILCTMYLRVKIHCILNVS